MSASIETTRPRTPSRATEYAMPVDTSADLDQVTQLGRPAPRLDDCHRIDAHPLVRIVVLAGPPTNQPMNPISLDLVDRLQG